MLTETTPREFHQSEVAGQELESTLTSPGQVVEQRLAKVSGPTQQSIKNGRKAQWHGLLTTDI